MDNFPKAIIEMTTELTEPLEVLCEHHDHCGLPASHGSFCILHSSEDDKDQSEFDRALQAHISSRGYWFVGFHFVHEYAWPAGSRIPEACFENTHFASKFSASGVIFEGRCSFANAKFASLTNFGNTKFLDQALFYNAKFKQQVAFVYATFADEVVFDDATLGDYSSFANATFRANAYFRNVTTKGTIIFARADFRGRAEFVGRSLSPIFRNTSVDMTELRGSSGLIFATADLTMADFLYTDLRAVHFFDVTWGTANSFTKRAIERARASLNSTRSEAAALEPLILISTTLRANYESAGNFEVAGVFRSAEKELRRLDPATSRGSRLFLMMHKVAADYGESLSRPIMLLLLMAVMSGTVLALLGMTEQNGARVPFTLSTTMKCCLYAFQTLLFQEPEYHVPETTLAVMYSSLLQVLGPALIGFLVFAFGRRVTR